MLLITSSLFNRGHCWCFKHITTAKNKSVLYFFSSTSGGTDFVPPDVLNCARISLSQRLDYRLQLMSQITTVLIWWGNISYSFPLPQNHYLLEGCFKSYYRKILSQISSPVNLTGPSFSRPVCYDREVKTNSRVLRQSSAWDRDGQRSETTKPHLVHLSIIYSSHGRSWHSPFTRQSCVSWDTEKPPGAGLKAGNPSRVNNTCLWGTAF